MIEFTSQGSFRKTEDFLRRMSTGEIYRALEKYAQEGLYALADATPMDAGETAHSWYYEITHKNKQFSLVFRNRHMAGTAPVAILVQYGHATKNGGYVEGRDFINPAIRPIFDKIATDVWKAVTK